MYVAIKVGMILAVEAGIFPLLCGWWIDICAFVSPPSLALSSLSLCPSLSPSLLPLSSLLVFLSPLLPPSIHESVFLFMTLFFPLSLLTLFLHFSPPRVCLGQRCPRDKRASKKLQVNRHVVHGTNTHTLYIPVDWNLWYLVGELLDSGNYL